MSAPESQPLPGDITAEVQGKLAAVNLKDSNAPSTQPSSVAASLREKPEGIRKTPFVDPLPTAKPVARVELTADQQTKYEETLEIVRSWTEVPSNAGKGGLITDDEIMWLTKECILRYLRATKWNTSEAAKRILGSLTWRREYGVAGLSAEHISPENETGKQIILGFDVAARPCLYMSPGRQNTDASPRQVQHLVYMVERLTDLMSPGQDTLAFMINFKSGKTRSNTAPPLSQGKEVLNILQTHYPERLGRACIINVPWIVWGFFKLITPFIDPLTREKLKFNEDNTNFVPADQLWTEFGGNVEFEYDHETYWPALTELCAERREEQKARWIAGGRKYGESELYLKGSETIPASPAEQETAAPSEKNTL